MDTAIVEQSPFPILPAYCDLENRVTITHHMHHGRRCRVCKGKPSLERVYDDLICHRQLLRL